MAYTPTAKDLTDLKAVLGISGTDQDTYLNHLIRITGSKAINSMNVSYLPPDFLPVLTDMCADAYYLDQTAKGEQTQSVSSISDNGQSVSYRESASDKLLAGIGKVLKDYESQMARFRKVGW